MALRVLSPGGVLGGIGVATGVVQLESLPGCWRLAGLPLLGERLPVEMRFHLIS